MRDLIAKTMVYYKNNGFIKTIGKTLCSLKPFIICVKVVMHHKQIAPSALVINDDLNIKVASREDIDANYQNIWHSREDALNKFDAGHLLFLVKEGSMNMLYIWVHLLQADLHCVGINNLSIPANIGYLASAYVPLQYRGRSLLKRSLKFIEKYLLDYTMVDRAFVIPLPDSIAASNAFESSGYVPYQQVLYLRIIGIKLYIVQSLDSTKPKRKKIFIQSSKFWNAFSSILKKN